MRCLDDIPKGQFICTYTGHLITEEESDIRAIENGDEYFAELDFVECLKKLNEGYKLSKNGIILKEEELDFENPFVLNKFKSATRTEYINHLHLPRILSRKNPISITANDQESTIIFLDSDEDEQGNLFRVEILIFQINKFIFLKLI